MSTTCGFFNSKNKDRMYNATHFGHCFDGIILDGILASIGDCFAVKAAGGMNITVGPGKSWYLASWLENDADLPMTHDVSDVVLSRIDAVVMDFDSNETVRWNDIKIIKGVTSSFPVAPELINNNTHKQIPLAFIEIPANSSEISQTNITSVIGTDICPFITGVLETVSIETLLGQWKSQFDDLFAQMEEQTEQSIAGTLIDGSVTRNKLAKETVDYIDSKARPYNYIHNANFSRFVAQVGIGGKHGNQAYAGDRWILDSGTVTGEANADGEGYSNITLNGTIRQIVANAPAVATPGIEMISGTATITYANGAVTVTSSGGVIGFVKLFEGEYTADNMPKGQPRGYAEELLLCQAVYFCASGYTAWTGYKSSKLYGFIAIPAQMRITPSVTATEIEVRGAAEAGESAATATIGVIGYGTFGNYIRLTLNASDVSNYQPTVVITKGLEVSADL